MTMNKDDFEEFLDNEFDSINEKTYEEDETIFPMSKGWDITKYLLQKLDFTNEKILLELNKTFIKFEKTVRIYNVIKNIDINDLMSIYNREEMIENDVYRSEMIKNKDFINHHLKAFQKGFKKASDLKDGIVIYYY